MFFRSPLYLFLIPVVAALILYAQRRIIPSGLRFSNGNLVKGLKASWKLRIAQKLFCLRITLLFLVVLALARPQAPIAGSKIQTEGIDIVLSIDCSTSMLAEDFKLAGRRQNRLEVVKEAVRDFIKGRQGDRIGIVTFAARAYTACPLTLDYGWLLENLERIKTGIIEDGTAIGSGIASSLNRLKNTNSKSKVVILLTDGRNNTGRISPLLAAETAKALKVKIYTIGAGSKGMAPFPAKDFFGNTVYQPVQIDIDEDTLMKIAQNSGGRYFRATDTESLREIYKEIDRLEKTTIEEKGYLEYEELFPYFLMPAVVLILLEIVLAHTVFRKIP